MGEFIDFGEPRDKYWKRDFERLIERTGQKIIVKELNFEKLEKSKYATPWEEFDQIKKALYSNCLAKRCFLAKPKHDWFWERSKEINILRNALYLQALRMLISSST